MAKLTVRVSTMVSKETGRAIRKHMKRTGFPRGFIIRLLLDAGLGKRPVMLILTPKVP